ncbi:SCO2322 family protein [Streptomyces sp. NPDC048290]|uniref:SCO2322 family protein n=1 Tax=Streptomyces sp. NPDC048290 TaxID=3155811 RepID=UPI00344A2E38
MTLRGLPVLLLAAVVLALTGLAGPAHATGYRYWSFWERAGGQWSYADRGPSLARPADGAVQGFRFAVSENSQDAAKPRGDASFAGICAGTEPRPDTKRVALVLDFGTRPDAPSGETPPAPRTACAQVAPDATTAEALAAVAKPLRYDSNALLCAIAGYPAKGCGEQVAAGAADQAPHGPNASDASGDSGPALGVWAGAAAVLALGGAAVWQTRRRRRA